MAETKRNKQGRIEDRWYTKKLLTDELGTPILDDKGKQQFVPSLKHGSGRRWMARYVPGTNEKEISRSFDRKKDAQEWLDLQMQSVNDGTHVNPKAEGITVRAVSEVWQAGLVGRTPATRATYEYLLNTKILTRWGGMAITDVNNADIILWVDELTKTMGKDNRPLSPSTVRQTYKLFSQILDVAVRNRMIAGNPAHHVPLPRIRKQAPKFLTAQEVERLACAADYLDSIRFDRTRAGVKAEAIELKRSAGKPVIPEVPMSKNGLLIRLFAYTGLRFGEMAAIKVGDVDLDQLRLVVHESVSEVIGEGMVTSDTKTHRQRRVPFRPEFAESLGRLMAGRPASAYLFVNEQGGAVRNRNWAKRVFAPAVALSEVWEGRDGNFTPHDLRHTTASLAISQGLHAKAVQGILGHASAAMTLDVYAGLFPDDLVAVR